MPIMFSPPPGPLMGLTLTRLYLLCSLFILSDLLCALALQVAPSMMYSRRIGDVFPEQLPQKQIPKESFRSVVNKQDLKFRPAPMPDGSLSDSVISTLVNLHQESLGGHVLTSTGGGVSTRSPISEVPSLETPRQGQGKKLPPPKKPFNKALVGYGREVRRDLARMKTENKEDKKHSGHAGISVVPVTANGVEKKKDESQQEFIGIKLDVDDRHDGQQRRGVEVEEQPGVSRLAPSSQSSQQQSSPRSRRLSLPVTLHSNRRQSSGDTNVVHSKSDGAVVRSRRAASDADDPFLFPGQRYYQENDINDGADHQDLSQPPSPNDRSFFGFSALCCGLGGGSPVRGRVEQHVGGERIQGYNVNGYNVNTGKSPQGRKRSTTTFPVASRHFRGDDSTLDNETPPQPEPEMPPAGSPSFGPQRQPRGTSSNALSSTFASRHRNSAPPAVPGFAGNDGLSDDENENLQGTFFEPEPASSPENSPRHISPRNRRHISRGRLRRTRSELHHRNDHYHFRGSTDRSTENYSPTSPTRSLSLNNRSCSNTNSPGNSPTNANGGRFLNMPFMYVCPRCKNNGPEVCAYASVMAPALAVGAASASLAAPAMLLGAAVTPFISKTLAVAAFDSEGQGPYCRCCRVAGALGLVSNGDVDQGNGQVDVSQVQGNQVEGAPQVNGVGQVGGSSSSSSGLAGGRGGTAGVSGSGGNSPGRRRSTGGDYQEGRGARSSRGHQEESASSSSPRRRNSARPRLRMHTTD